MKIVFIYVVSILTWLALAVWHLEPGGVFETFDSVRHFGLGYWLGVFFLIVSFGILVFFLRRDVSRFIESKLKENK
ncbi:hypothetical protein VITU102760_24975 [Vibrio tubiashii]|uniref:Uncharacterized protein n=1 Tax=Vibrio tubiashii ATCC 19109 TaxID=1051646 RepID=F9T6P6_9VIBR|nr:hypothetical protein IX91_26045 [Vibrio tubiashii ATCC 19109]EGU54451.1 hypothetical protein VITU9109_02717 [Vibrio tubiashii ATCC 19109]EIF05903.1 hypothetical protein VT1337_01100 [Vibrio tubiashii NCIMB 1337 = ATCC 19106]